ncbi:hypothetical protein [Defluviimonas salinarum]|uniref:Uncharacterized protein n=1 Tax=Defluviimonas salinarum TaxID=2992147 RepID=A0ABT3J889_9RHOB|nr:hypothetical protein [Defluviimonas salinarum]MCW3783903.1 hypothetical protein [Defluviimonas salinarum]
MPAIDLARAAAILTGRADLTHHADLPLGDSVVHRFREAGDDVDFLHLVSDAAGGFRAHLCDQGDTTPFRRGHLADLTGAPRRVLFEFDIRVTDETAFKKHFDVVAIEEIDAETFQERFLVPEDPFAFEQGNHVAFVALGRNGDRIVARVGVEVTDEARLTRAARDAYENNWGDRDWHPGSAEEALYEILAASNANPSPDAIGFEFMDWRPLPAPGDPETGPEPETDHSPM